MVLKNTIGLVITTYNRAGLLKRAIESIYNYGFSEIILVNDGSDDTNSVEISKLLVNYPKIIYHKHPKNMGLGEARNTGVRLSHSEWIMYLDDDDYFIKDPTDDLLKLILKNPGADIIHFKIRNQQTNKDICDWGHEKFTLTELIENNRLAGCSMLKKSVWQILNGYKTMPYEDWEFWIRAKKANFNFCFYKDIFYFREHHEGGLEDIAGKNLSDEKWRNKYISYLLPSVKMNSEIGIGITTFLRDSALFRLISSIQNHMPEIKIYIADQGEHTPKKDSLYSCLKDQGHVIKYLPYDSGISKARRILKEICEEKYLVYMEDDFEVQETTDLYKMKEILDENPDIGVVGGNIQGYAATGAYSYFFNRADNTICYFPLDYLMHKNLCQWEYSNRGIKFLRADIVSDFTMWRKEVPNIFDDNVKTIEHSHVYLLVKYKTNYKVAFCPESEIKHAHSAENPNYTQLRKRTEDLNYLNSYWNVKNFVQFNQQQLTDLEKLIVNIEQVDIQFAVTEKKEIPFIAPEQIYTVTEEGQILNLFHKLESVSIHFWLLEKTCLDFVNHKPLNINPIYLGTTSLENKRIIENYAKELNINPIIKVENRKTKTIALGDLKIHVPIPVVGYLIGIYGNNWEELKNE